MEKIKRNIVLARSIRAFIFLLFISFFSYILILCSQVQVVESNISESNEKSQTVELKVRNPNSLSNWFVLNDLSKTEYKLNYPFKKQNDQALWVLEKYDDITLETEKLSVCYSDIEGGEAASFKEILAIFPYSSVIRFYTRNITSENLQMIRNFLLTELILFLLALFGKEIYKLIIDVSVGKRYVKQRLINKSVHRNIMITYIVLSLFSIVMLFCINIVPVNDIRSEYYTQKSNSIFSPFDISCAYQHINIPSNCRSNLDVEWHSEEIVKFVPDKQVSPRCEMGPKSLVFKDVSMNDDFDVMFYTCNLQSANYQEIRLFVLTTLLLFFLERSFFYFRRWFRNKSKR